MQNRKIFGCWNKCKEILDTRKSFDIVSGWIKAKQVTDMPTLSHGNSYVFYEVANSYEFVRPHSYDLSKPQ